MEIDRSEGGHEVNEYPRLTIGPFPEVFWALPAETAAQYFAQVVEPLRFRPKVGRSQKPGIYVLSFALQKDASEFADQWAHNFGSSSLKVYDGVTVRASGLSTQGF